MYKKVFNYFDKFEDRIRGSLSKFPITYTIIGAIAIVLFWRGVWHTADLLQAQGGILGFIFDAPVSVVVVLIVLLATGLFVSSFIGDSILISGLKQEKKLHEKTQKEVMEEEVTLSEIKSVINEMKKEVNEIKEVVEHEHHDHHEHK